MEGGMGRYTYSKYQERNAGALRASTRGGNSFPSMNMYTVYGLYRDAEIELFHHDLHPKKMYDQKELTIGTDSFGQEQGQEI